MPRPHLLYVAWGFPPSRGAGVYRALATANAFADAGWDVTVLTAPREVFTDIFGADPSLEARVHPAVRVRRVRQDLPLQEADLAHFSRARVASEPAWFSAAYRLSALQFPEPVYGLWGRALESAAVHVHAARPVDLVIGTSNPHVDFVPGRLLHQRFGVPYVMDYRDGWALDVTTGRRTSPPRSRAWRIERRLLLDATEAWFVNEPIRAWYAEALPEIAGRTRVVANGFDGDLSAAIDAARPMPPARDEPLTFGYLGTLYGAVPLRALLEGWRLARAASPEVARARLVMRGHLGHYGRPEESTLRVLAGYADDGVTHEGPVPRADVAAAYASFDVLTLPLIPGRFVTSGKVFEYAATGLPIVSVHGSDSAASSVLDGHPAWVLPRSLAAADVADALAEGARLARESTPESVAATRRWARAHAREEQLAPRVAALEDLVAQRARTSGAQIPEPTAHDRAPEETGARAAPAAGSPPLDRVLLLVGSTEPADVVLARAAGTGDLAERLARAGEPAHVTVVCRISPREEIPGVARIHVLAGGGTGLAALGDSARYRALDAAVRRTVPGRVLATVSPFDDTRTTWRAVRADSTAKALARESDLVVAVDLPAVRAAWSWLRRRVVPRAVYGVSTAERIARSRA